MELGLGLFRYIGVRIYHIIHSVYIKGCIEADDKAGVILIVIGEDVHY